MDELGKELKLGFLEEVSQLLTEAETCFLDLEKSPDDADLINQIFRLAHNIKGSANAVGFNHVGEFAHQFESLLLKVKRGELKSSPLLVSLFLKCNDHIFRSIAGLKQDLDFYADPSSILGEIALAMTGEYQPVAAPEAGMGTHPADPVEAFVSEAVIGLPAPSKAAVPTAAPLDETVRVSTQRLEKLLNFVGEMVILQTVLSEQAVGSSSLVRRTVHQLGKVTKEIQDISMSLRMLPMKPVFQKMQRIVRDTAQALNKTVDFSYSGENTEVDKTVLEILSDPLVHLIRNAVDHGIESNERRRQNGKASSGRIELNAFHESGRLIIEIKDDGGGIDPNILREKAVEKGVISPGAVLTDKEAIHLIFHAGFSTKQETTDVSGRGVGMDVVRSNIERVQGIIDIETVVGQGTLFRVTLPLTLAIIDAMVVRIGAERYVIPMYQVHESLRPNARDVQYNVGVGETLLLRGENLPLYRANGIHRTKVKSPVEESIAIIVRSEKQPFAILVDDILGQQQVVIKKLGAEIQNLPCFSGCAILGDGRPVLILELSQLVRSQSVARDADRRLAV